MSSGGHLFDEGLYGCIFRPSLQCKDRRKQPSPSTDPIHPPLSKLILKEDAEIEMKISTIIQTIPSWNNYFAVSESICEPAKKQNDPELLECPSVQRYSLSDFRILSMTYHGVPLTTYHFKLTSFDFMKFAQHLIEAGALLNLYGIVHRDIHAGNIIVDSYSVPRIIDFNLSIQTHEKVSSADLRHQHNTITAHEPPDSTLINAVTQDYSYDEVIQKIVFEKPVIKKLQAIFQFSSDEMYRSLLRFYQKSTFLKEKDATEWFHQHWRTIDSWAIGVNLSLLFLKFSGISAFPHHSFSTLLPVLRQMCAISPVDRIDCVQALYQLDPQHPIIRKEGKQWLDSVGYGI